MLLGCHHTLSHICAHLMQGSYPKLFPPQVVAFNSLRLVKKNNPTVALYLVPLWQLSVNYLTDSVRVKQTDRRARHQLLELLLGKIKALETNECTAFTLLLYNLYPVNPSITSAHYS